MIKTVFSHVTTFQFADPSIRYKNTLLLKVSDLVWSEAAELSWLCEDCCCFGFVLTKIDMARAAHAGLVLHKQVYIEPPQRKYRLSV